MTFVNLSHYLSTHFPLAELAFNYLFRAPVNLMLPHFPLNNPVFTALFTASAFVLFEIIPLEHLRASVLSVPTAEGHSTNKFPDTNVIGKSA